MNARVIAALDLPERSRIVALARDLAPHVAMVKLGLEAFVEHGPDLVREVRELGARVFLDLKLHDIPRTVAAATRAARTLDVDLLTLHASGGREMMTAAVGEAEDIQLLAVTALTSLDDRALDEIGYDGAADQVVRRLGALALDSGVQGLVLSALELEALSGLGGLRVVPGVRPAGTAQGDQKRVATPEVAVANGASYIVVGRPIVQAADPVAAARSIEASIAGVEVGQV